MSYPDNFNKCMESYKSLKDQYDLLTESDKYTEAYSKAPFELISAINICDLLKFFNSDNTKRKMEFTSAQDASSIYFEIINFRHKKDKVLEQADTLIQAGNIESKINKLIESTPYLPQSLQIDMDAQIYDMAKECAKKIPEYPKLLSKKFRNRFTESCIEYLSVEELDALLLDKTIRNENLDTIAPLGSEMYNTHLLHLCSVFGRDSILTNEMKLSLRGVTFPNDDGSSRQELLKQIKNTIDAGQKVNITATQCMFTPKLGTPEPSVQIDWNGKTLGFLAKDVAQHLTEFPPASTALKVGIRNITGGGDVVYGCDVDLKIYSMVKDVSQEVTR